MPDSSEPDTMNWPFSKRGDIAGVLLIAVALGIAVFVMLVYPELGQKQNFGFGPEWQCARMEQGDPICVRLVDRERAK